VTEHVFTLATNTDASVSSLVHGQIGILLLRALRSVPSDELETTTVKSRSSLGKQRQACFPLCNRHSVGSSLPHDPPSFLHVANVVSPIAVIKKQHLFVGNERVLVQDGEVGRGLVARKRWGSPDLQVTVKPVWPPLGQNVENCCAWHHLNDAECCAADRNCARCVG
jgi:hypothetical protein